MKRSLRQAAALKLAWSHIQHMASWIASQQKGYSFEALGEDQHEIETAIKLSDREDRFVKQREDSDCLRCCLAGILNLPWEVVPDFVAFDGPRWYEAMLEWLHDQGLHMMRFQGHYPHNGLYLVDGWTTRHETHVVIYRGLNMVWDPHESAEGLTHVRNSYWLLPLDAADVLT